jgi:hypothetical protein
MRLANNARWRLKNSKMLLGANLSLCFSALNSRFGRLFSVHAHGKFENQQKIVTFALRLSFRKKEYPK